MSNDPRQYASQIEASLRQEVRELEMIIETRDMTIKNLKESDAYLKRHIRKQMDSPRF